MSFELSRSDRKILFITAAVFLVLVVASLLFVSPEGNQKPVPSTYSSDSSGAKAAYLLLQETGYHVQRWERPLIELGARGRRETLIIAEPERFAGRQERTALHKFISNGGRVIATGRLASSMLPEDWCVSNTEIGSGWRTFTAITPCQITRAAPRITIARPVRWHSDSPAFALYGDNQEIVVVSYSYGEGKVIWWAAATPLTNAGIKESGNLEFFLACIGDKENTQVLWDEYSHGYSSAPAETYESKLAVGMLAQLFLLAAAALFTFSRRSGPVRPSVTDIRLSPLEFVETLGDLYERAHAAAVAVDICYQRFLYWLTKRLGMPNNASVEQLERAVRDRWNFQDEQFAATLRRCASTRHSLDFHPKQALQLVRSLHAYAIKLGLFPAHTKEKREWKPFRSF